MTASLETLFLPLENGSIAPESPALFLGAEAHPYLRNLSCDLWQPWKPSAQGLPIVENIPDKQYSLALVSLPKQVEEAKYWLALALEKLSVGGILVAAAANDAGGARLEKWFVEAGLEPSSLSKNKCRVVWAARPVKNSPVVEDWKQSGLPRLLDFGDDNQMMTQPGLFSWDRLDAGSKLLVKYFEDLKGTGADFGSGIGFLSRQLLKSSTPPKHLYVLEADSRCLACAKQNLGSVSGDCTLTFGWEDLTKPVPNLPPLDFIVMNPPFHTGKSTQTSLGQSFIQMAAHHLRKGGILRLVANAHLPYEDVLKNSFTRVRSIEEKDGFKILEGVK